MAIFNRAMIKRMGLLVGFFLLMPIGVQPMCGDPPRVILAGDMGHVAEPESSWAIRPAEGANPAMQQPDTQAEMGARVPAMDTMHSEVKTDNGIRYVSGGIGDNERNELNTMGGAFNLHLMFATKGSGKYLSAVQVRVLDTTNSPVLTAVSNGPWLFAQLPPGQYKVEVTPTGNRGHNETQSKTVNLDNIGRSQMDFYWDDEAPTQDE
ncbi:carboxypeptidase-like regulatory domain-containing protein [Thiorhodovibrio frisius]|uniref:Carboxypeptidase regulatory-like domain-containing protein n=1 Tax=Thiorhodovibrio frisius TaxID=631362 RepID=H8Z2D5_9GAMM|nr:carboxypeptidase-like regulatory domain-containing protein [Thiorhodovibrio frisius]EIC21590.1 hypothetical protein Thi970DRAFT_01806 [Thiorhodovibrio frisius]WPL21557.1 hypothetical protein Thiofri_01683 [Thiorhodovibrio frisius]